MSDEQIIEQVKNGNDSAFRELVLKYESRIAATVIGMLGNCSEAEDVGQEVFIRFYNAIEKFRGESSLATYLTRIAINLSLNEIKRRKRKNLFFIRQDDFEVENTAESDDKNYDDVNELIQQAIKELDPNFRSVVVLRLIDGYSTEETAKILKIPIGTVLSRLARAQQKLRKKLAPLLEVNHG